MAERTKKNGTQKKMDARLVTLRSELETLQTDMKGIADDVEGIADNRVHLAIRKAENVAQRAYRFAEDSATHVADDVEAWANGNVESARKSIRAQPISALALSIGAGALLGAIIGVVSRRSPSDSD
jgi:ElaB/YqjD/DUF883 family membrane-anchored ribosome-binding protein